MNDDLDLEVMAILPEAVKNYENFSGDKVGLVILADIPMPQQKTIRKVKNSVMVMNNELPEHLNYARSSLPASLPTNKKSIK